MTQPDAALLASMLQESMQRGETPSLTLTSDSMLPLLRRGDQVQVEPVTAAQLRPGDVVTLVDERDRTQLLTHRYWGRIAQDDGRTLVTRGDRPLWFDPPCPERNLVGRVMARRRDGRYLSLEDGAGAWLNRRLAWLAQVEMRWLTGARPAALSAPVVAQSNARATQQRRRPDVRLARRGLLLVSTIVTTVVEFMIR